MSPAAERLATALADRYRIARELVVRGDPRFEAILRRLGLATA